MSLYWLNERTGLWEEQNQVLVDYEFGNATGYTQKEGLFALIAVPRTASQSIQEKSLQQQLNLR